MNDDDDDDYNDDDDEKSASSLSVQSFSIYSYRKIIFVLLNCDVDDDNNNNGKEQARYSHI